MGVLLEISYEYLEKSKLGDYCEETKGSDYDSPKHISFIITAGKVVDSP